jgi:methionyl-tRNA synthetase
LNLFRVLMIYLQPVLPEMAAKSRTFFRESDWTWGDAAKPLLAASILPYEPLAIRLDPKAVAQLVDPVSPAEAPAKPTPVTRTTPTLPATAVTTAKSATPTTSRVTSGGADTAALAAANAVEGNMISIDDFLRIDLRVAKIISAGLIDGADKLLKLKIDVGDLGQREIFAGIRAAYDPATLEGRLIVVVANLEPRKMRFGTSEGMMLAAGPGGKDIFVLSPDSGAVPGMRIK